MKVTVISIIFLILFISLSSAAGIGFTFSFDEEAEAQENISVSLEANISSKYDVKIYIESKNSSIISEIWDGKWKSPFYYIKESFPEESKYIIRAKQAEENGKLCIRLRETGKTAYSEVCNNITIHESSNTEEESDEEESEDEENNPGDSIEDNSSDNSNESHPSNISIKRQSQKVQPQNANTGSAINEENKIILLNTKEALEEAWQSTPQEKLRSALIYSFAGFCLCLCILLAFKKL